MPRYEDAESEDEAKPLLLVPIDSPATTCCGGRFTRHNVIVLTLTIAVIVLGTVNRVMYKYVTIPMKQYTYFLSNFNATCYTILYFTIFFGRFFMKKITPDMLREARRKSWWKILIIGTMDSLGNVLGLIGAAHLSGPLIVLLPNGTILFTIIVSMIILKQRYNVWQLLGAGIILSGVFVTILPEVLGQTVQTAPFYFYLIYFFSTLPNAISFCLKELTFKVQKDLDLFVVNSFGSGCQLVFTWLLFPIVAIPGLTPVYVPISELGQYLVRAAYCFGGVNIDSQFPIDACHGAPILPVTYIVINLTWNICLLALLKKGGAFYMFIAITASMPIAENLFTINLPLLTATPFSWFHIGGLLIILTGLIGYRVATYLKDKKAKEAEAATAGQTINSVVFVDESADD
eukprot:TRINITY_DN9727_c0_g1_i1.p1 TRINITY_DN9727_c0_g1~~TRINITY_DN9727_c0_g1_i1.p1  ORF type:complete len:403 (+),score=77.37 TRINITY_DN9727_c0_g1_i1:101-1309(+)